MKKTKERLWCLLVWSIMCFMCFSSKACASEAEMLYTYEQDEYGNRKIVGFQYWENDYSFEYDERGIITYIRDEGGKRIAYYCCDDIGNVEAIYSMGLNGWEVNTDEDFIGNINKIRWLGYEYDEDTMCYMIDDRYFSVIDQKFLDGVDNEFAYSDINPFLPKEEGIMLLDSYYNDIAAEEWAEALLADDTFGVSMAYSNNWYNSLSTVEKLARCIYCEGGTAYETEGNAVAWVIRNRVESSQFPNTPGEVILQNNQFTSITGRSGETKQARMPATSSSRWRNATYMACFLLTTTEETEWRSVINSTINGQLYFFSYTYSQENEGGPFSGTSSGSLYYNSSRITNVYVLGYGYVSSFDTLFANYNPISYSRNIYYDYY